MESAPTISASSLRATSMALVVFPEAVGPVITKMGIDFGLELDDNSIPFLPGVGFRPREYVPERGDRVGNVRQNQSCPFPQEVLLLRLD